MSLRVGLLASGDQALKHGVADDAVAVRAADDEVEAIEVACRANGFEPHVVRADRDPRRTLDGLARARAHVVFHLTESIGGEARMEAAVAALLEWAGIPYTGSSPTALTVALDKPLARAALASRGVAVPAGFVLDRPTDPIPPEVFSAHLSDGRRWIVKPAREDASHGIAIESVVATESALRARAAYVIATYAQPALVEEFVEGRELCVSILGGGPDARLLPFGEIDFSRFPRGAPRLVTYAAKWIEDSPDYRGTPSIAARPLAPELESLVGSRALAAYNALGLTGYGRVDLRIDDDQGARAGSADRGPLVLDVNPNPDLSPDGGLARAAARGGIDYAQLIARIVEGALEKHAAPARLASR